MSAQYIGKEANNDAWDQMVSAHKENALTIELVRGVYPLAIGFTVTEDGILRCKYNNDDWRQSDWWRDEVELGNIYFDIIKKM